MLTFVRSYRGNIVNPFVWLCESIASTRASNLPFEIRCERKIRGSHGGCRGKLVVSDRYLHGFESTNPSHSPLAPLNQLTISLARFVSPATNKQQNEPRPYLASATIARETRQIPDSEPLLSTEIYLLRPLPRARHPTRTSFQIRIGSLSPPVGYILIGIVGTSLRDPHLNTKHINNFLTRQDSWFLLNEKRRCKRREKLTSRRWLLQYNSQSILYFWKWKKTLLLSPHSPYQFT